MVFNATFNNISVISWQSFLLVEKTTNPSKVTDKLFHKCCIEYTPPWTWLELTALVVICTDCTGSCKCNYHTITTTPRLLWNESLKSDGQQFTQYQQNKQSPLNSDSQQFHQYQQQNNHLNSLDIKRPQHLTFEIQVLLLDSHIHVARISRILGFRHHPLDNWISNDNTYINKQYKTAQILFHSKSPHTITKMNINMNSTIAELMNARS